MYDASNDRGHLVLRRWVWHSSALRGRVRGGERMLLEGLEFLSSERIIQGIAEERHARTRHVDAHFSTRRGRQEEYEQPHSGHLLGRSEFVLPGSASHTARCERAAHVAHRARPVLSIRESDHTPIS